MLGPRLATIHNLHYYQALMRRIRDAIERDGLDLLAAEVRSAYTEAG